MSDDFDPLENQSAPSVSFKDAAIGTTHYIDVVEPCDFVQCRDFDTDEPAVWPDGKPRMAAVFKGADENGEVRSLWCEKPSDLLSKMQAAQKELGRRIGMGDVVDRIHVRLADRVPAKNPKYTKKVHEVKITHPGPKPTKAATSDPLADPWGSAPAAPAAATAQGEPPF